jgi:hypothetical protein
VTALLVAGVIGVCYVLLAAGGGDEDEPASEVTTAAGVPDRPEDDRSSRRADPDAPAVAPEPTFASIAGVALEHPGVQLAAFHEAAHAEALRLDPVGELVANHNPDDFSPDDDRPGAPYRVLASLDRPRAATSGVDLVLDAGAAVLAPVDGEVVSIRQYALPGGGRDWRVVIEPAEQPDLHVLVTYLQEPQVRVGQEVQAGVSPLAVVRDLPFERPVDRHLDEPGPSAHVEVRAAHRPEPPDPNEPAVLPGS